MEASVGALNPDGPSPREQFAALPTVRYQDGEIVLRTGSKTSQLFILNRGAVAIIKDGVEIARISDPGASFGELSFLLDQSRPTEVRAVESAEFSVADAAALPAQQALSLNDIAAIVKRIDIANQMLIELTGQIGSGVPGTNSKKNHSEESLDSTGASLVYAGYPYDPYALNDFLVHQIQAVCRLLSAR
jgi:hypothetical protein